MSINENDFEIILSVNEGEKFSFGNVDVTNKLKKMNSEIIKESLPFKSGDIYDASKIKDSIEEIKNIAELNGYSFVEINPILKKNDENKIIEINIEINEGPRVYVNNINISGNTRTIDKVIRREFALSEGDAYNKYAINYSKDSIRALNLSLIHI